VATTRAVYGLFAGAVFLSALLVFLVEPLVGRLLLPVLGGSAMVWNTSLAFFQAALLAGYAYAHLLQRLKAWRMQVGVHLLVLAVAALVLPLHVSHILGEPWLKAPALWLFAVLTLTLGAPFAALSATAPLIQAWCARLDITPPRGGEVYGLYAASNLGSLLALVAYPMLVEPAIGLRLQSQAWSLGYGLFCLALAGAAAVVWRRPVVSRDMAHAGQSTGWGRRLAWMALSAAPSSLLLGVTGHISADVAAAPFLWVAPLILYLLAFVIAFARPAPASPGLLGLQFVSVAVALLMLLGPERVPWLVQVIIHLTAFFATALVCARALVVRRPEPARLTEFYLLISLGGVIGGAFNALIAPQIFDQVWEYPAVLALSALARPRTRTPMDTWRWLALAVGVTWTVPLYLHGLHAPRLLWDVMLLVPAAAAVLMFNRPAALCLLFLAFALGAQSSYDTRFVASFRSFFGVTHVRELADKNLGPIRMLVHGSTMHGVQAIRPQLRCLPTSYYARPTVIGQVYAVEQARRPGMRIGVAGLGAGTTAALIRRGDSLRYFEIDPLMQRIAVRSRWFDFVRGCARGRVDVVLGDARLKLRQEPLGSYDLLMMDAFSGDSVPTHLLTTEAIGEDLRHLKPGGILLMHLSNRNLDLLPSAAASARATGAAVIAGVYVTPSGRTEYAEASGIVLLAAASPRTLDPYRGRPGWGVPPIDATRPWTDDYTDVLAAMMRRLSTPDWTQLR
jgi:SAM-dependent methyltransferase